MKFGAFSMATARGDLAATARLAEELGFESVWMGEHLGFPTQFKSAYPYDEGGIPKAFQSGRRTLGQANTAVFLSTSRDI